MAKINPVRVAEQPDSFAMSRELAGRCDTPLKDLDWLINRAAVNGVLTPLAGREVPKDLPMQK